MAKLITVVGNSGVGKTTFTRALCDRLPLITGLEQHRERPFQKLFALDLSRYALANQVDYLLLRAEQEFAIRRDQTPGILDGGLDEDFHVFTKLFYHKGYLPEAEFRLCERLYGMLRSLLTPPELTIYLVAPQDVILARYSQRNRPLEIANRHDLAAIQILLEIWLKEQWGGTILTIDASADDPSYNQEIDAILPAIQALWL